MVPFLFVLVLGIQGVNKRKARTCSVSLGLFLLQKWSGEMVGDKDEIGQGCQAQNVGTSVSFPQSIEGTARMDLSMLFCSFW